MEKKKKKRVEKNRIANMAEEQDNETQNRIEQNGIGENQTLSQEV